MKRIIHSALTFDTSVLICFLLNSCHYYEVKSFESSNRPVMFEEIKTACDSQRYVILHASNNIYALKNVALDSSIEIVTGKLDTIDANHQFYLKYPDSKERNRLYKPNRPKEAGVIHETHLYTNKSTDNIYGSNLSVPVDSISRVKVMARNKSLSTVTSVLYGGFGIFCFVYLLIILSQLNNGF